MEKVCNHVVMERYWIEKWRAANLLELESKSGNCPFTLILPPIPDSNNLSLRQVHLFTLADIISRRKKMQGEGVQVIPGIEYRAVSGKGMGLFSSDPIVDLEGGGFTFGRNSNQVKTKIQLLKIIKNRFEQLFRQGDLRKETRPMNICCTCNRVLSDSEMQYKNVPGTLFYIKYPLGGNSKEEYILVATARPEIILGEVAVAVNHQDERYRGLIGKEVNLPLVDRTVKIIADAGVKIGFGSGAMGIAPAHDGHDYQIARRQGLDPVCIMNHRGQMEGPIPSRYRGLDRLACRELILSELKKSKLIKEEKSAMHRVAHCRQCGTISEYRLGTHWLLNTRRMSGFTKEKFKNEITTFYPPRWAGMFLEWLDKQNEWCVSQPAPAGMEMPVCHCRNCSAVTVLDVPLKCDICGAHEFKKSKDFMDPWFMLALWPLLHSHGNFPYPFSLLICDSDLLVLWAYRVMILQTYLEHEFPFRETLVLEGKPRRILQKSVPEENGWSNVRGVMHEYGADTLRFFMVTQSFHIEPSSCLKDKMKRTRAFINKIWNASRYVLLNRFSQSECGEIDPGQLSDVDKWFLHYLNISVMRINDFLDDYRIKEAADLLFQVFRRQFCRWYLEFSKGDKDFSTRQVLQYSLKVFLTMLHPFIPFITEEIFHRFAPGKDLLSKENFPSFQSRWVFPVQYNNIEMLRNLITQTRKMKSENHLNTEPETTLILKSASKKNRALMAAYLGYFNRLCGSKSTKIVSQLSPEIRGYKMVFKSWEIMLTFPEEGYRINEIKKLQKDLTKIKAHIFKLEKTLSSTRIPAKNTGNVFSKCKKQLQDQLKKKDRLEKKINDLS